MVILLMRRPVFPSRLLYLPALPCRLTNRRRIMLEQHPTRCDHPPTVIPGLDPGIYVDGRIKSGHDGQGKRFNLNGFRSSTLMLVPFRRVARKRGEGSRRAVELETRQT